MLKIPEDSTHWEKVQFNKERPAQYRFYQVFGPDNDIIFIWWEGRWAHFREYQAWVLKYGRARLAPPVPDFSSRYFNRHAETANDKIRRIANEVAQQNGATL